MAEMAAAVEAGTGLGLEVAGGDLALVEEGSTEDDIGDEDLGLICPLEEVTRPFLEIEEDTEGGELRVCGTGEVLDSLEPTELADWGLAAISSERGETAFWARSSAGPFRDELAWLTPFIRPELPSIMSDSILLQALVNMASGHDLESN